MAKSSGKPWDLTTGHSLEGAAEWIRKRSDALVVLVIREKDAACAVDREQLLPLDTVTLIRDELPRLLQYLIDCQAQASPKKLSSGKSSRKEISR